MKHRWIGGLVLAVALTLAACAPPGGGASSGDPSQAPESMAPMESHDMDSHAPSESGDDSGGQYDY